jgi:hypothetical protein
VTEGLGDLFLDPSPPHRTLLAGVGAGVSAWFCIYQTETAWEVFEGVVVAGTGGAKDKVTRVNFIASSTGSTVNFGGGTKIVYNTVPAREVLARGRALQELTDGGLAATARTNLGAGATGAVVFGAATQAAGRTALGGSTFGGSVFGAADAAAARTLLGLLSAALRDVGVGASNQIPDRAAADARYAAAVHHHFATDGSVKAPFYMSTAPTGWTRITTGIEGCAIRLVHSGGGTAIPPSGTFQDVATAIAKGVALTVTQMPAHTHPPPADNGFDAFIHSATSGATRAATASGSNWARSTATGATGGGAAHSHAIDLAHASFLLASYTG